MRISDLSHTPGLQGSSNKALYKSRLAFCGPLLIVLHDTLMRTTIRDTKELTLTLAGLKGVAYDPRDDSGLPGAQPTAIDKKQELEGDLGNAGQKYQVKSPPEELVRPRHRRTTTRQSESLWRVRLKRRLCEG